MIRRLHFLLACLLGCHALSVRAWEIAGERPAVLLQGEEAQYVSRRIGAGDKTTDLHLVFFNSGKFTLKIVDQPSDAPEAHQRLNQVMRGRTAVAGINGGFFEKDWQPLGLTIVDGERIGTWKDSSLLSGLVTVRKGKLEMLWKEEFRDRPGIEQLLQAGPRLVKDSAAVTGFRNDRETARTFLATDQKNQWLLGICTGSTLTDLAVILATPAIIPEMRVNRALNLDGGRSTGLWMMKADGKAVYFKETSAVRNMVALVPLGN